MGEPNASARLLARAAPVAQVARNLKGRWTMAVAYKINPVDGACRDFARVHGGAVGLEEGGLAPLLEGARARGVADALELAGQPAILLGRAGDVLHAGASARPLLGDGLRLENGRLELKHPQDHAFDSLLETVLVGDEPPYGAGITLSAPGGGEMRVRFLPFAGGKANPAQLLKALVLLDRVL